MTLNDQETEAYIRRQIDRLPPPIGRAIRGLRRPEALWLRLLVGVLLILGGLLWFLPLLGFWMLPLGVLLIAEVVPVVRRALVGLAMRIDRRCHSAGRPPRRPGTRPPGDPA